MRTLWFLLLSTPTVCQAPVEDLSPLLRGLPQKHKVPAVGLAVIQDFRLTGTGVAGVRHRGSKVAVTRGDLWHLGSCTKAMTATLCAILAEEGKLKLTTTLPTAFPDVKVHTALAKVRILDLLTHQSGLLPNPTVGDLWTRLRNHSGTVEAARRIVVAELLPREPAFPPQQKSNYSNAGYMIAGAYIERTLKTSWEEAMRRRLFRPLGMAETGFGPPGLGKPDSQPWGHDGLGKPVPPGPDADNPQALGPAGTVHATLADWSKFIILHLREQPPAQGGAGATGGAPSAAKAAKPILSHAAIRRLHQPVGKAKDYALGWGVTRRAWAGGRTLVHSGSNTMWHCVCWVGPEEGIALLATCNQGGKAAAAACDAACVAAIRAIRARKKK